MLSISAVKGVKYYLDLSQGDYYLKGGEPPGHWLGRGASLLGLSGEVEREKLEELSGGFHPFSGEKLVQNAGRTSGRGHHPGWDFTFSAPKSVSLAWALSDPATREAITAAHEKAVRFAFSYLESEAGMSRVGQGGTDRLPATLVAAAFRHGTSRAQDPQLHTHVVVANVAIGKDGESRTVFAKPLFEHKMTAGALYRAELASELERLRFTIDEWRHRDPQKQRTHSWFEVAEVPLHVTEYFSTRRREILAALAERGLNSAEAAKVAALDTRSRKEHVALAELLPRWSAQARELGFDSGRLSTRERTRWNTHSPRKELRELVDELHDRLTLKPSFSERDFVRRLATEGQWRGLSGARCVLEAKRVLKEDCRFQKLQDGRFTTGAYQKTEHQVLKRLEKAERRDVHATVVRRVEAVAARNELTAKETEAVRRAVSGGKLRSVSELSNAALTATVDLYAQAGLRTLVLSGTRARADEVQGALHQKTGTVARFLDAHAPPRSVTLWNILRRPKQNVGKAIANALGVTTPPPFRKELVARTSFQANAAWAAGLISKREKKYLDWQRERHHLQVDVKTVIIVERASWLRAQDVSALLEVAKRNGSKLIFANEGRYRESELERGHEAKRASEREEGREAELRRKAAEETRRRARTAEMEWSR